MRGAAGLAPSPALCSSPPPRPWPPPLAPAPPAPPPAARRAGPRSVPGAMLQARVHRGHPRAAGWAAW